MVQGKLQPTVEEEIKKKGHATIFVGLYRLSEGTVNEDKKWVVDANPSDIIVRYNNREIIFKVVDMVKEAVDLVDKS
jgi:hypothetical protein